MGRSMTVVILAEESDAPVDLVVEELAARGVPTFRADTSWFPGRLVLDARLDGSADWVGELRTDHRRVDLSEIRSVWARGPGAFRFAPGMSDAERTYAHREARLGLGGVLASLNTRWVNHPNRAADSTYKPLQLATAARCGLETITTAVTNDPAAVRRLVNECQHGVVQTRFGE